VVLFGGLKSSPDVWLDDTWEFDGVTWSQRQADIRPSPRSTFAMTYDADRHTTVLYGGESTNSSYVNDTWEWDGDSWRQTVSLNSIPSARFHHSMVFHNSLHKIVMFGGITDRTMGANIFGDTWELLIHP
jgi:hypothetical protein